MTSFSDSAVEVRGLLVSHDFIYTTKICDTARALGGKIQVVANGVSAQQQLNNQEFPLLLIDLETGASVLPFVREFQTQFPAMMVIAFGPHVEKELLQQARDVGCQQVMPRSKFSMQLVSLLETYLLCREG